MVKRTKNMAKPQNGGVYFGIMPLRNEGRCSVTNGYVLL